LQEITNLNEIKSGHFVDDLSIPMALWTSKNQF